MTERKPPIFIGGLMKSGTSLLRKLLGNHDNVFGGLETHWFSPDISENFRDFSSQRQVWLRDFYEVSLEEQQRLAEGASRGSEYFERFMWFCTERAGKQRWVEKTPGNVLHLGLIASAFPRASFLHSVRDYRDVYASWKVNGKAGIDGFLTQARAALSAVTDVHGLPYAEVDYADLVTQPEATLKRVCEFIGEPWDGRLAQYEGDDWDRQKVLAVSGKESPTAVSLAKPIFTQSVQRWREILSDDEARTIERELGHAMLRWGWLK